MNWHSRIRSFVNSQNLCLDYWPKCFISKQSRIDVEIEEFLSNVDKNDELPEINDLIENKESNHVSSFRYFYGKFGFKRKTRNHGHTKIRWKERKADEARIESCNKIKMKKRKLNFLVDSQRMKTDYESRVSSRRVFLKDGTYIPGESLHTNIRFKLPFGKMEYEDDELVPEPEDVFFSEFIQEPSNGCLPNLDEQESMQDFSNIPNAYSGLWESDIQAEENSLPYGFVIVSNPNFRRFKGWN